VQLVGVVLVAGVVLVVTFIEARSRTIPEGLHFFLELLEQKMEFPKRHVPLSGFVTFLFTPPDLVTFSRRSHLVEV
jgi:hypothetical protein